MLKRSLIFLILIIAAAFISGSFAIYNLKSKSSHHEFMVNNGTWRVNPSMDLKTPKQRALIAIIGLFALRESEVVYFTAVDDSDGNPLSSTHDYILSGSIPEARYWSYTLYGEDDFLIPNEQKLYGYNGNTIQYMPQDSLNPEIHVSGQLSYTIEISSEEKERNWLPSGNNKQLALTLRLYNPSPEVYQNLETIPLPEITRIK